MTIKIKGKILVNKVKYCKTIFSKAKGLMFSKRLEDEALIFIFKKEKINHLHNFFVFYPVDILFLDKDKMIIEMKSLKPFSIYLQKKRSKYVIELPGGIIKDKNIKIGSVAVF
jgi:hypothetical protein